MYTDKHRASVYAGHFNTEEATQPKTGNGPGNKRQHCFGQLCCEKQEEAFCFPASVLSSSASSVESVRVPGHGACSKDLTHIQPSKQAWEVQNLHTHLRFTPLTVIDLLKKTQATNSIWKSMTLRAAKEGGNLSQLTEMDLLLLLLRKRDNYRQFQWVLDYHSGMNLTPMLNYH